MKTKCVDAWASLETTPEGSVRICCMSTQSLLPTHIGSTSLEKYTDSPLLKEIQQSMLNGERHPNCNLCWQEEDAGRDSKRIRDNELYAGYDEISKKIDQPTILDLKLGTRCNIKCRTCGHFNSSAWVDENLYFATNDDQKHNITDFQQRVEKAYDDDNKNFWGVIDKWLPNLKHIDMYGGEPMLMKKQWEIVKKSAELGYSKNQSLHYNTNGTIFKPEYLDILKNYKTVSIQFSIDGIFDMFEYLRYPAKWNRVYANIIKYKKAVDDATNFHMDICLTISIYNIYYIDDIANFMQDNLNLSVYLNLVHTPNYFNITNIPNSIKPLISEKLLKNYKKTNVGSNRLKPVLDFMQATSYDKKEFDEFLTVTARHDLYRNQSFEKTFPEFTNLIKENYV